MYVGIQQIEKGLFMKKKSWLIIITILIVMGAVFALTGCTTFDNFRETFFEDKGVTEDTITIGVIEPQSGTNSAAGQLEIDGIELAHSMKSKVLGKKIKLVYADTQSNIYTAETAIADLIDKKPTFILGTYGDAASLVVSDYVKKAQIPSITVTATNPLITKNNPYYCRTTFSEASQGGVVADYIVNSLGEKTAAVMKIKGDDTVAAMVSNFNTKMGTLTGNSESVLADINIDIDDTAFEKYVKALKNSKAKTVFIPVDLVTADKIFEQVVKEKLTDIEFVGPSTWHKDETIVLQQKYQGIKISVVGDFSANTKNDENPMHKDFIKAYEKEFYSDDPPEATALAFDAYMLAVEAIEKAQSTESGKIIEAIGKTQGFKGVSGEITFNANGDPIKPINIDVIRNGKFVSAYTVK